MLSIRTGCKRLLGKVRKNGISVHTLIHPPSQCGCCVQHVCRPGDARKRRAAFRIRGDASPWNTGVDQAVVQGEVRVLQRQAWSGLEGRPS